MNINITLLILLLSLQATPSFSSTDGIISYEKFHRLNSPANRVNDKGWLGLGFNHNSAAGDYKFKAVYILTCYIFYLLCR